MFKNIINYFFDVKIAFYIFIVFIIVYLFLLEEEGAFKEKFLNFGPSPNTNFLSMRLDTWEKVILVYIVGFLSTFLTAYYNTVSYDFIHSYIWNPAYTKKIKMTKRMTQIIVAIEPILQWILSIINLFINLTMELQFIIPQFLGEVAIQVPYAFFKIDQKKFNKK